MAASKSAAGTVTVSLTWLDESFSIVALIFV